MLGLYGKEVNQMSPTTTCTGNYQSTPDQWAFDSFPNMSLLIH